MDHHNTDQCVILLHPIVSKLDANNYIVWRKQVQVMLRDHNLQSFFLSKVVSPSEFTLERNRENGNVNLTFISRDWQDQLVNSWLMASISDSVLSYLVSIRAKISQFKTQLNGIKKGSMSINEYLLKIQNIIDLLAMVRETTKAKEYIEYIYSGLPDEYENFIISMDTRLDPLSVLKLSLCFLHKKLELKISISLRLTLPWPTSLNMRIPVGIEVVDPILVTTQVTTIRHYLEEVIRHSSIHWKR